MKNDKSKEAANPGSGPRQDGAANQGVAMAPPASGIDVVDAHAPANIASIFVGDKRLEINPQTPPILVRYLKETNQNTRVQSLDEAVHMAEDFFAHIEEERQISAEVREALKNPRSAEYRQSLHMANLQRQIFAQPGLIDLNSPHFKSGPWRDWVLEGLGRDSMDGVTEQDVRELLAFEVRHPYLVTSNQSPFSKNKVEVPHGAREVFAMMLLGKQGELTPDQAQYGFELAASGQLVMHDLKEVSKIGAERLDFRKNLRHSANRSDESGKWTHPAETPTGLALQNDVGTKQNKQMRLPVMMGTSGTTSDAALSTMWAAFMTGQSWMAPGLGRTRAAEAMTRLGLYYMREQVAADTVQKNQLNPFRMKLGHNPMNVPLSNVFVHSFPEVYAGGMLTLKGIDPSNKKIDEEMAKVLAEAGDHLLDAGWTVPPKQPPKRPDMTPSLRDLANPPPSLGQLQSRYAAPAPMMPPHDPDADLADQKQALKQRRDELAKALAAQKGDTVNVTAPLDSIFVETMGLLRPTSRKHVEEEVARLNEQIQSIDQQRQSQRAAMVAKELEHHVKASQARRDHLDHALAASHGDEVYVEDPMDMMPGKVPMRRSRAEVLAERKKLEQDIDKAVANIETLRSSSAKPQDIARILIENGASVDHDGGVVQDGDQTTRWQVRGGALQIVQSTDARSGNLVSGKQAQKDEKRTIISPDGRETVVIDKKKSGRQWGTWVDDESHEIQTGGRRVGDATQISIGPTGHSKTKTQWNFTDNRGSKDTRKRVLGLSDGLAGAGGEIRKSSGEHDADGKLTKGNEGYAKGSAGAVLGSQGLGLGAKGEAGGKHMWDPDKSVSGKVAGGISFTVKAKYNMQAKCYEVLATFSIELSAAGAGEAGAKRSMGPGMSKATGNLGVQGSFKRTLIRRLDAKELPEYMQQWSMTSSTGTPGGAGYEFDLLRLGLAHGPEALVNMLKGSEVHARGLGVEDEISGKVEAGLGGEHQRGDAPAKRAATISAGVGFEAGMVLKRSIVPVVNNPKLLKCWFELSTERTFSGNLSGGFGYASVGVKGGITRGTTDTMTFQAPNRPEIAAELHALTSKDAIMAFLKSHDLRAATGHVDSAEDSFGPTAGVGPLSASLVTSILSANGTEVDEEGNTRYYTMGGMRDKGLLKFGDVELDSDVHEESYSARTGVDGQVSARAVVKQSRSTALGSLKKKADDLVQNPFATVGDAISNPSKTLNKLLTGVTEDREQGMMLGTTEVEIIAARAKDPAKWYKFIENAKDKSDWIKLRKAIELAELGLEGMADYQKTFVRRKLINEAIAEFMKSSHRGRASMIWAVVRKDNIGDQKQLDVTEEWSAEAAGGATGRGLMYELPDGLGSLADEIETYVFKDVLAGPAKQIQAGDAAGAAAALGAIISTLQSLATKVTDAKDKFASTAQLGELLQAIRARQAKARAMFGQKLEDQMQTRYGELKSNCRAYLGQEQNVLGQLNESIADGHESTGDAATRIKRVNDLKLLHEVWGREYSELVRLATDLGMDPKDYEGLGPSKRMLQQAHDSKVADVHEQMEEDRRATEVTRNNLEAGARLMQSLAADPSSIAAVNARRLAEQEKAKAGVAGAQRARIAAARTKALMGAGKFNFAKKENRQINPAAEKKFGDGYTQIALAGQDAKDWEGLAGPGATMGGQPIPPDYLVKKADAIVAKYGVAESLFKEGDALM